MYSEVESMVALAGRANVEADARVYGRLYVGDTHRSRALRYGAEFAPFDFGPMRGYERSKIMSAFTLAIDSIVSEGAPARVWCQIVADKSVLADCHLWVAGNADNVGTAKETCPNCTAYVSTISRLTSTLGEMSDNMAKQSKWIVEARTSDLDELYMMRGAAMVGGGSGSDRALDMVEKLLDQGIQHYTRRASLEGKANPGTSVANPDDVEHVKRILDNIRDGAYPDTQLTIILSSLKQFFREMGAS